MINAITFVYAVLGGVLPALVWLAFWLLEDYKRPEPRRLILKTFILGVVAVALVLPFQKAIDTIFPGTIFISVLLWAVFEECFKFGAAYFGGLKSSEDNEPIDPIIYMITAALGFAAMENVLFLLGALTGTSTVESVITGNLRFLGASLLHVVSSGMIGVSLSFTFYKSRESRAIWTTLALVSAIIFHIGFNLLIMHWQSRGTLLAFIFVWIGAVVLLLAFEKAKVIRPDVVAR